MQLYCPTCQASFSGTQRCPRCAGLLLMPHESAEALAPRDAQVPVRPQTQSGPVGRVFVGALFALGLYLGLRKLATGVVLALVADAESWWETSESLVAVCGAQAVAVAFGAVMAAASRSGGAAFGAVVGVICGSLFLAAELVTGAPPRALVLYLQLGGALVVGTIAGAIAGRVWGAVPALELETGNRVRLSSSRFVVGPSGKHGRPTEWARVLIGSVVALSSIALADQLRQSAEQLTGGTLRVGSIGQAQFVTWQIAILGALGAGVLTSAGTGSGLRHGFIAGALTAVGVLGLIAAQGVKLVPVAFSLSEIGLGGRPPNDPLALGVAFAGTMWLVTVGGWLGDLLFPPLAPEHARAPSKFGQS